MNKQRKMRIDDGMDKLFGTDQKEYKIGIEMLDKPVKCKRNITPYEQEEKSERKVERSALEAQAAWQRKVDESCGAMFYFDVIFPNKEMRDEFCEKNGLLLEDDMYIFGEDLQSILNKIKRR